MQGAVRCREGRAVPQTQLTASLVVGPRIRGFLSQRVSLWYSRNCHITTMTQPASETPLRAFSAPVVLSGGRGALGSCQLVQVWTGPVAGRV